MYSARRATGSRSGLKRKNFMGNGREKFPYMFSKGGFGRFETKNRVRYAACYVSNYNNPDGSLSEGEFAR